MMMLGSKGLLPPLIPDCSALRALTILKNIRNPLIFLRKMASYSCFWRVPRLKIFMQASLHQISNLLTLVSYDYSITFLMVRKYPADKSFIPGESSCYCSHPAKKRRAVKLGIFVQNAHENISQHNRVNSSVLPSSTKLSNDFSV